VGSNGMKKTLLIIMSVAILGALGMYINKTPASSAKLVSSPTSSNNSTSQPAGTGTSSSASQAAAATSYKDGTFNGSTDTAYGPVDIAVVINGGKITDVRFMQMPSSHDYSRQVTAYAEPLLKQTTLQNQSSNIDFVSGATSTSNGFEQSLQMALDQAKMS